MRGVAEVKEKRWEEAELQTGLSDGYGCRDWESMGEEMCRKRGSRSCDREGWNHRAGTTI